MKIISLTKGKITNVDDEDYEFLSRWKWCTHSGGYAIRNSNKLEREQGLPNIIYMHRVLMGVNAGFIDHIDGNKLNNVRSNLRLCNLSDNNRNVSAKCNNTSGYRGVSWSAHAKKWRAYCNINGSRKHIGYFSNIKEAALAYNEVAKNSYGEFARLNNVS